MDEKAILLAQVILDGFNHHFAIFTDYNKKGAQYFAESNAHGASIAAQEQVGLYDLRVQECIEVINKMFKSIDLDELLWQKIKRAYMHKLYDHLQPELAESFYNSVFCRLFNRRYYCNQYIFLNPAINIQNIQTDSPDYRSYYPIQNGLKTEVMRLLQEIHIELEYEDLSRDVAYLCQSFLQYQAQLLNLSKHFQIHVASPVFYRNKGAYVIGRIINNTHIYPFIIPLLNRNNQLYVDAFLNEADDISNVFSFTRAYFKVDFSVPSALIHFMKSILPQRTLADLYTSIGFHKQGKNEFYRAFLYHLRHSNDEFIIAPGIEGMVMYVFTLPSYPYVFKIIKDKFHPNKNITHELVKERYQMVKQVDRVGRMADTWEFSHVAFPLNRFSDTCLDKLKQECGSNICVEGEHLIIRHLYIERRMIPLNIYITQIDALEKKRILKDYGLAIHEIASAGLFAGDLLMKNFGVTRHGRVVFYDYDEVVPIGECNFRAIPEPQTLEQELSAEPWFHVGKNDIFPEEFAYYLVTDPELKSQLVECCPELMAHQSWKVIQESVRTGVLPTIYPYSSEKRYS